MVVEFHGHRGKDHIFCHGHVGYNLLNPRELVFQAMYNRTDPGEVEDGVQRKYFQVRAMVVVRLGRWRHMAGCRRAAR